MSAQPQEHYEVTNPFSQNVVARPAGSHAVSEAVVQREIAEVQAAVVMAKRFPRNPIIAMDRIMQACSRPTLAECAVYQYARGGTDIDGPSIRLAEAIAQNWGNILSGVTILQSDAGKSECIAYAWDLETNFRDEKRFTVKHWRDTKQGGYAIKDERDIYELAANMGARRKRACILAVIPGDVVEAALNQIELTMKAKMEITPDLINSLLASFEKFGVGKEQIEKRIQRRIESITPALVVSLKKIYTSLKDGMSKPEEWFEAVVEPAAPAIEAAPRTRTAAIKEKARATRQAHTPQPQEPPPREQTPVQERGGVDETPDDIPDEGMPPLVTLKTVLDYIAKAVNSDQADMALDLGRGYLTKAEYAEAIEAYNEKFRTTI